MVPKQTRGGRKPEPLEVQLSVRFRFGPDPDDHVTVLDEQRVPMVNSVFANRDRIVRGFGVLLLKAAAMQPKVIKELVPAMKLMRLIRGARG